MNKHIEIITSTSGSLFLKRLVIELEQLGYKVNLVTSVDTEKTPSSGLLKRWRMYPGFAIKVVFHIIFCSKADIRISTTNPFFIPFISALTSKRKCLTVNLIWDLFPDALEVSNVLNPKSFVSAFLALITKVAIKKSKVTVCLGDHLMRHTIKRYGSPRHIEVIPVGADGSKFLNKTFESLNNNKKVIILYSGNLGKMHDTRTLIEYFKNSACDEKSLFTWSFYASGSGYTLLQNEIKGHRNIVFNNFLSNDKWVDVMNCSSISLVTIKEGAQNVVMPSKTYSSLVAGQALLAICPKESDLAQIILKFNCGWVVAPGDVVSLTNLIEYLEKNPEEIQVKRELAYEVGHNLYDMSVIAKSWSQLFENYEKLRL